MSLRRLLLQWSLIVAAVPVALHAQRVADFATVPLMVESNRPYIMVTFHKSDGSTRTARFLLDTGGGGFLITEPLARELGLAMGEVSHEEGSAFASVLKTPSVSVGAFPLALDPERVLVLIGKDNVLPNTKAGHAEGMMPGHVLSRYHVVFDYPDSTFTIGKPGSIKPRGTSFRMPVSPKSGFPRIEWSVSGVSHGMLLDTGASFTMVSEVLLKKWGSEHPEWPRHPGAFGEAATLGGVTLETMFIPEARLGDFPLRDVGVTSQRAGTFERYMSGMTREPIVGSLAGNVLKQFRVELDYTHETLYLTKR